MLLVIGAMKEELSQIITIKKAQLVNKKPFLIYQISDQILICVSGIGLTNAASALTYSLINYSIDCILILGTVGSVSKSYHQGDIVFIEKALYGNANVQAFNYQLGQIPQMPENFQANCSMLKLAWKKNYCQFNCFKVNCASLDMFITTSQQVENLIVPLPLKIGVVDMEIASYYHVAYLFQKPILAIKVISDSVVSVQSSTLEFNDFLPIASQKIVQILDNFLKFEK